MSLEGLTHLELDLSHGSVPPHDVVAGLALSEGLVDLRLNLSHHCMMVDGDGVWPASHPSSSNPRCPLHATACVALARALSQLRRLHTLVLRLPDTGLRPSDAVALMAGIGAIGGSLRRLELDLEDNPALLKAPETRAALARLMLATHVNIQPRALLAGAATPHH